MMQAETVLKDEMHRIAAGHLGFGSAAMDVCRQSLRTIAEQLPVIRDHESEEVRRISATILAMLAMTLRNVSHSITYPIVAPGRIRDILDEAGVADTKDAEMLADYEALLRLEEWGGIQIAAERALAEADAIAAGSEPARQTTDRGPSDETAIYGVREVGPNGTDIGFIDLAKLNLNDPVHDAYRTAVLEAAGQRRRQGYGRASLPHEGMLLLMCEVPKQASVPDAAMPFVIHGFATLEAED